MRQSSIIIHKGGKEEKYEIYVEDYVLSFLKEETGTLELSELYFYGFKEKYGRKYTIYGVGRDKHLAVFDKYSLLEEIGCRLTQAGPVFLVREETELYEVKGYDAFYQDNAQMQTYLIERKEGNNSRTKESSSAEPDKNIGADRMKERGASSGIMPQNAPHRQISHSAISVQLSAILVILIAIVINSTNSYDKMQQLNQSATEVFFAMENQEAEQTGQTGSEQKDIVARRDPSQDEDVLKLAALENSGQKETTEDAVGQEEGWESENRAALQETEVSGEETPDTTGQDEAEGQTSAGNNKAEGQESTETEQKTGETEQESGEETQQSEAAQEDQEEVEALSRNVARYYKVERGDTLYTISQKIYGDTDHVQKICELNQITDPDRIRDGQKIILP